MVFPFGGNGYVESVRLTMCFLLLSSDRMDGEENEDVYQCTECEQGFCYKRDLVKHMISNHREVAEMPCTEDGCNETFSRMWNLLDHMASRHGKLVPCTHCDDQFPSTKARAAHNNRHHKLVWCDCGKGFRSMYGLNDHQRHGRCKRKTSVDPYMLQDEKELEEMARGITHLYGNGE